MALSSGGPAATLTAGAALAAVNEESAPASVALEAPDGGALFDLELSAVVLLREPPHPPTRKQDGHLPKPADQHTSSSGDDGRAAAKAKGRRRKREQKAQGGDDDDRSSSSGEAGSAGDEGGESEGEYSDGEADAASAAALEAWGLKAEPEPSNSLSGLSGAPGEVTHNTTPPRRASKKAQGALQALRALNSEARATSLFSRLNRCLD